MFLARVSLVALTIASAVTASPLAARYAVHEKRDRIPNGWEKVGKLPADMTLPMRIALKQSNLHLGHGHLMDVSDPTSESYGQHWSAERIAEFFAPSQESEDAVKSWLVSSGIADGRISRSFGQGWLELQATAREIESLLQTDLHMYRHESGQGQVACTKYSLPESLREHIDFITPTVHFDAQLSKRTDKSQLTRRESSGGPIKGSKFVPNSFAVKSPDQGKSAGSLGFSPHSLAHCDENITLDCLRALYKIPPGITANPKNSFGITEYSNFYLPTDLDMFFSVFAPEMVGDRPILNSIDGGTIYYPQESFGLNGEADLDLQYAMGLVYPQKVQLFQVGDNVEGASFNTFLDALDASYCTYDGGDDPTQDPIYPDPYTNYTGAYEGPKACGTYEPTWVISTSYGYGEVDLTPFYEERQCYEYMKLGLQGVTVLYSSGDNGVAGGPAGTPMCWDPATDQYVDGTTGGRFVPGFPATCPYVTGVGATQIRPNATVTQPEIASETVIYSGGGFSDNFPLPSYQEKAVGEYFAKYNPPYTAAQYNNSQKTRGFPDVSANGAWYVVAVDGLFESVFGTSCSSPVFGSIVTLINEARFDLGKGPVGFINPTLYQNPQVLHDITAGNNPGCGTTGFSAVPGWDPVTGLGTPDFPSMLALFLGFK